ELFARGHLPETYILLLAGGSQASAVGTEQQTLDLAAITRKRAHKPAGGSIAHLNPYPQRGVAAGKGQAFSIRTQGHGVPTQEKRPLIARGVPDLDRLVCPRRCQPRTVWAKGQAEHPPGVAAQRAHRGAFDVPDHYALVVAGRSKLFAVRPEDN